MAAAQLAAGRFTREPGFRNPRMEAIGGKTTVFPVA